VKLFSKGAAERGEETSSRAVWWPRGRKGLVLVALLLLVFLARAGWVVHVQAIDREILRKPDTPSYVLPALALERDGQFTEHPGDPSPMYFRTPGYPAFIAAIFLGAGEHDLPVMFAQIVLSVVAIWLAWVLANRLWGFTEGMVVAVILAIDPLQFWASGKYLTESLSAFLVIAMVAIAMLVASQRMRRPGWIFLLGLTLAVATLVRPVTYYLCILGVAFLVVAALRTRQRAHVIGLIAFTVPVVLLVGGWQVRNHYEVGTWRIAGVEGLNMYSYRAAGVIAKVEDRDYDAVRSQLRRQLDDRPAGYAQGEYFDDLYDRGFDIVSAHPVELVAITAGGFVSEATGAGEEVFPEFFLFELPGFGKVVLTVALALFWIATVYGVVRALVFDRRRRAIHLAALAIVGYIMLASAGPEAYWRMRVPVVPVLALYAAFGGVDAFRRGRARWRRSSALTAG
jgi:4-amino-4-deoxy-L-arabinose transferase-like glycosyltransferase